ncbi:MAG: cysteine desulfurase family protein [Xanthobacteraceae bacterium]
MATARAYLDWNATAPLRAEARVAMTEAFDIVGNPSSVHGEGRAARKIIEAARDQVAALVGAKPAHVTFTSGGTEANVLALTPAIVDGQDRRRRERLLVSAVEHPSVSAGGRFGPPEKLKATRSGTPDLAALASWLATAKANNAGMLVSVMLANNETGVIMPIRAIADLVHEAGGHLHVDAVQAAGKIPVDLDALGADFLSISAHKFGGPKGVGALIKSRDALHIFDPLIPGGGQERGTRGGTENLIGIAGMGAAAKATLAALPDMARVADMRDGLERELRAIAPNTVVFGVDGASDHPPRLPNTTLFAVPGVKSETSIMALDLAGVAVSAGSACSSGKVAASPVLAAMGVPAELASCAIRLSLGPATTRAELDLFLKAWKDRVATLSKQQPGLAA